MSRDRAIAWLAGHHVPRETSHRLDAFVGVLEEANRSQNLIARSTINDVWTRHILDSAQLLAFGPDDGDWLDLGSGPGFPGLIVAALSSCRITLVEARAKRVLFLREAAKILAVDVIIEACKVERVPSKSFAVISARAFAPLPRLLDMAHRFSTPDTVWILPKGRGAQEELDRIGETWHGDFSLEPSITDPQAHIVIARNVRPKESR